jgi:Tol biopolymer transport system component/predicted Ser/Thr protein kinase
MLGTTVSHYTILEKLGEGGMGIVYKAEDLNLTRTVALKFLPHGLDAHEPERARFLQESRAAAILNHPNICTIHDIQEHEGQQFIVMEYVDGTTLRHKIQERQLRIGEAIDFTVQIGEALSEAHSKGIVHRDIKTDNIMINAKGQIKVMDFGLAKLKGSLKLTKTSSTVGTLSYMAPEQIEGKDVDARSDIFSFGVVLYEMLTGHLPFRGEHDAAMMYSILNEEPEPVQESRPDISSDFIHIIDRALDKDPEDRYQTVHDMVIDLRRLKKTTTRVIRTLAVGAPSEAAGEPSGATPEQRPRPRKRRIVILSAVGLMVLIVVAAYLTLLAPRPQKLNPNMSVRTLEIPFTQIQFPSLSRDGNWIAFAARDARSEWAIYFMNIAKRDPRRLTTEALTDVAYAEISPDGSEVLYDYKPAGRPHGVYVVSSLGGTGRRIAEPGEGARWRPDHQLIGYIRYGMFDDPSPSGKREFWTVSPDGKENHLQFIDSMCYVMGNYCFDWSRDGKSIAWLRSFPGYEEIIIRELESGKERQLTSSGKPITELSWASNEQILFTSSRGGNTNIWTIPAGGGEAIQVTKGSGPDLGVRVSGDARRLLFLEQRSIAHLWTADIDGHNAKEITFDDQNLISPSYSPDNAQICFQMSSADLLRPGGHIYIMQSDGSNRLQLTAGEGRHSSPAWSPDGKYMLYSSRRIDETMDSSRIYLIEISNPAIPRLVVEGVGALWIDGEKFVCCVAPSRLHSTVYSIHDSQPLGVSEDTSWAFPLRDGRNSLIWDYRPGRRGWWLSTAGIGPGPERKQILSSDYLFSAWPSYSLRYLLYMKANGEGWRISLPDGKQQRLPGILDGLNPWAGRFQLSYDDKRIVLAKGRFDARLVLIENLFE